jgi:hypothetical protein
MYLSKYLIKSFSSSRPKRRQNVYHLRRRFSRGKSFNGAHPRIIEKYEEKSPAGSEFSLKKL